MNIHTVLTDSQKLGIYKACLYWSRHKIMTRARVIISLKQLIPDISLRQVVDIVDEFEWS